MGRAYVIGAGLAGLVAAERLSAQGREVVLLEASPKAGGRCRSYFDTHLERTIDNGNHLVLSANRDLIGWVDGLGGAAGLEIGAPEFPFLDLGSQSRWTLRFGNGRLGGFVAGARPPGVTLPALLGDAARLLAARRGRTVAETLGGGRAFEPFWDPMTRAILNEAPETGSAALLRATFLRIASGGAATARPVFMRKGLGAALVEPALKRLAERNIVPRYRTPVTALSGGDRLDAIETSERRLDLARDDVVVLAVPVRQAARLLPHLALPEGGHTILNAHFRAEDTELPRLLGLLGGQAHWLFRCGDVISATVSAAEASPLAAMSRDEALAAIWADISASVAAHGGEVPDHMPPARLVRERGATFDQSPNGVSRRPRARTPWRNLVLAGDYVQTGLPATLEGAVRSGIAAARIAARTVA